MDLEKQRDQTSRRDLRLILASASPRRKQLLQGLHLPFEVVPSGVEEFLSGGMPPSEEAKKLAFEKALEVARLAPEEIILGADTLIALNSEILGKPESAAQAREMLKKLRGRTHSVITGLALVRRVDEIQLCGCVETLVAMRDYDESEIEEYVASGEPLDKAGSYAIQGEGGRLVSAIEGCYNNVVGLPLCRLESLLAECDVELPARRPVCRLPSGVLCPETGREK